jgi:hypothetical protein
MKIGFQNRYPYSTRKTQPRVAHSNEPISPTDRVSLSGSEKKPERHGLVDSLRRVARRTAIAALNGVGFVALALLGSKPSEGELADYKVAEQKLSSDVAFEERVAESGFDGVLELFEREDLPGQSAKERLDFVLWYTSCKRGKLGGSWHQLKKEYTHFNTTTPFVRQANDRGFAQDVRDGFKWYDAEATGWTETRPTGKIEMGSPQVGHFLTAVDIGHQAAPVERLLRIPALGHELIGDDQSETRQILEGLVSPHRLHLFNKAISAAEQQERSEAHKAVREALPELTENGDEAGRVGNSWQDLLNTSYGIAFGRKVRSGELETRAEAAAWLSSNVGDSAPSLSWNDS